MWFFSIRPAVIRMLVPGVSFCTNLSVVFSVLLMPVLLGD